MHTATYTIIFFMASLCCTFCKLNTFFGLMCLV
jgi:hypothetical protein